MVARDARPSLVARVAPSMRERCWTAVVKKELDETSSQRSKLWEKRIRRYGHVKRKILPSLVPILNNVVKVELDDRPDSRGDISRV